MSINSSQNDVEVFCVAVVSDKNTIIRWRTKPEMSNL